MLPLPAHLVETKPIQQQRRHQCSAGNDHEKSKRKDMEEHLHGSATAKVFIWALNWAAAIQVPPIWLVLGIISLTRGPWRYAA